MTDKCKTFVARWDHAMCSTCGEEHNRPAPTPTPAPGLDLDAVERDVAHLDGPHSLFDDRTLGRVLAVCNAAPALIAEVRALRAAAEEREADMHARIRAGYDKTVADAWRAEVAKRDAEIADLRALVESQRRDYLDVCDAIAPETSGPADAAAKVRALRAKIADAKRLGMEAHRIADDAIDDRYTQFYDERGNGPDVIRMDVEPMPTVIERNCHLVFARSEDDDFHATRFVPGGYRLDDRSSQWLMGRLMLWMSGQLVFTGYKDAARNLPGPIDVDGIVASVPDALRVELRDALTAAIDAPRLAARLKPEVVAAAHGYQLLRTSAGEWGTLWQDSEDDPSDDEPAWLADEAAARLDYEDSTGQRRCESCGTYRDSEERSVDEDGIYTCADESACSAACAAKESAK